MITVVAARRAACTAATPPGSDSSSNASPPCRGSRHRAAGGASSPGVARVATNNRSPSEVNVGADSPVLPWVSRRAGCTPSGSNSHIAVTYSVRSGLSSLIVVTTRAPSGDTARPATLGSAK